MKIMEDYYKKLLLSVYLPQKDFEVVLTNRTTRKIAGTYNCSKNRIRINNGSRSVDSCIKTAIHEYAHHIHCTEKGRVEGGHKPHGPQFKLIFHVLLTLAIQKKLYEDELVNDLVI